MFIFCSVNVFVFSSVDRLTNISANVYRIHGVEIGVMGGGARKIRKAMLQGARTLREKSSTTG